MLSLFCTRLSGFDHKEVKVTYQRANLKPIKTSLFFSAICPSILSALSVMPMMLVTILTVLSSPQANADSVLGIELSPAICKLNPQMANLRQCIEGNPMTVNFYQVLNQPCNNNRYSMSPLQENIASKVIPDVNVRKNIWQQYGRCSGMNTSNYFRQVTNLSSQLKLPKELSSGRSYRFAHNGFIRQLVSLNAGLQPKSISLYCQKGSMGQAVLSYINICYNNNGSFGQCTTQSTSCPSQFIIDGNY